MSAETRKTNLKLTVKKNQSLKTITEKHKLLKRKYDRLVDKQSNISIKHVKLEKKEAEQSQNTLKKTKTGTLERKGYKSSKK